MGRAATRTEFQVETVPSRVDPKTRLVSGRLKALLVVHELEESVRRKLDVVLADVGDGKPLHYVGDLVIVGTVNLEPQGRGTVRQPKEFVNAVLHVIEGRSEHLGEVKSPSLFGEHLSNLDFTECIRLIQRVSIKSVNPWQLQVLEGPTRVCVRIALDVSKAKLVKLFI